MIQTLIKVINYFNSIIIISQIIENAVAIFGNYTDIVMTCSPKTEPL